MQQQILLFGFLFSAFAASAQWEFNVPFYYSQPLSQLKTAGYENGFGSGFSLTSKSLTSRYNPFKVQLGAELDFFRAGKNDVTLELSNPANGTGRYRLINRHNGFSFYTRFSQEVHPKFRFFQDILLGSRTFKTTSKLKVLYDLTDDYDDVIETAEREVSFRYGAAVGFRYNITRVVGFNARAVYNGGNSVSFVDLNSLEKLPDNSPRYALKTPKQSPQLFFGIGLTISFVKSEFEPRPNPNVAPRPTAPVQQESTLERERRLRRERYEQQQEERRRREEERIKRSRKPSVKKKEGGR